MFDRKQTIAEYTQHLPDGDSFTLGQALSALKAFYTETCNGCEDDGLVFLTGVFDSESPNFQIVLARSYDLFSQLTIAIQYPKGFMSRLTPETNIAATERSESRQFFVDSIATRAFWLFKNAKPLQCSITYEDADDRGDEFYTRFAKFAAMM